MPCTLFHLLISFNVPEEYMMIMTDLPAHHVSSVAFPTLFHNITDFYQPPVLETTMTTRLQRPTTSTCMYLTPSQAEQIFEWTWIALLDMPRLLH